MRQPRAYDPFVIFQHPHTRNVKIKMLFKLKITRVLKNKICGWSAYIKNRANEPRRLHLIDSSPKIIYSPASDKSLISLFSHTQTHIYTSCGFFITPPPPSPPSSTCVGRFPFMHRLCTSRLWEITRRVLRRLVKEKRVNEFY